MKELLRLANEVSSKYPVKDEVNRLIEKCDARISNGACEQYEIEVCYESIKELVNNVETKIKELAKI